MCLSSDLFLCCRGCIFVSNATKQLTFCNVCRVRQFCRLRRSCMRSLISPLRTSVWYYCQIGKCWKTRNRWLIRRFFLHYLCSLRKKALRMLQIFLNTANSLTQPIKISWVWLWIHSWRFYLHYLYSLRKNALRVLQVFFLNIANSLTQSIKIHEFGYGFIPENCKSFDIYISVPWLQTL